MEDIGMKHEDDLFPGVPYVDNIKQVRKNICKIDKSLEDYNPNVLSVYEFTDEELEAVVASDEIYIDVKNESSRVAAKWWAKALCDAARNRQHNPKTITEDRQTIFTKDLAIAIDKDVNEKGRAEIFYGPYSELGGTDIILYNAVAKNFSGNNPSTALWDMRCPQALLIVTKENIILRDMKDNPCNKPRVIFSKPVAVKA